MKLSIVIPAYNEAANLPTTLDEFKNVLSEIACEYEILVVDDQSSDDTYQLITQRNDSACRVIRLSRRSGSHVAIRAGLAQTNSDCVLVVSADGQEPPDVLPRILKEWQNGNQIVWGLRQSRADESFAAKTFAELFYKVLSWMSETPSPVDLSRADFYLLDRIVVDSLNRCQERHTSLFGLIVWLGFRQSSVEYERRPRRLGASRWNFRSRFRLAKDWVIAFSSLPLRAITYLGFVVASIGFIYALFIISRTFFYGYVEQGWASLITTALLLGGIQMIMLGIIGEYIARSFDETRGRPVFFIEAQSPHHKIGNKDHD